MSSITFPHGSMDGRASTSSSSIHDDGYFDSPSFSASGSGSFQMNPLSSHPPRTPRTSLIVSNSHVYGGDIYTPKEEVIEQQPEYFSDDEEEKKDVAHDGVSKEEVWREIVKTSYGRDKTFKTIQYSMRLYLLFHSTMTRSTLFRQSKRPPWEAELIKRFEAGIAGFSLVRKCLIMFNWLGPLTSIMAQHSADDGLTSGRPSKSPKKSRPLLHTFLHASPPTLLELANGLSDDIYTFSRLGLLGKRTGERAAYYADWCWFLTTLVNLVENGVERSVITEQRHQVESRLYSESMLGATAKSNPTANKLDEKELARLQRQDYWIILSRIKLMMDLVFVSYNVFGLKRAKSSIQTLTGLAAALLSTAKTYEKHKTELVKALKDH